MLWALALFGAACGATDTEDLQGDTICGDRHDDFVQTQAEVDALEGCDIWKGNLVLRPELDLSPLDGLRIVEGSLSLGDEFVRFDALPNLETVGGLLGLRASMEVLHFPKLRTLGGLFWLRPKVTDFSAFPALDSLDYLSLSGGDIQSLRGLERVQEMGRLELDSQRNLESLDGLRGLRRIRERFDMIGPSRVPDAEVQAFIERTGVPVWHLGK